MFNISIIAAVGKNNELGKEGKLPWYISDDLKRFKKLTSGHTVIMGRKTFESINNKPLINRRNIILTKEHKFGQAQIEVVHSLDDTLKIIDPAEEVFVVGGAAIYKLFLPVANKLYLTVIHKSFHADVFFPEFSRKDWFEIKHIDNIDDTQ